VKVAITAGVMVEYFSDVPPSESAEE